MTYHLDIPVIRTEFLPSKKYQYAKLNRVLLQPCMQGFDIPKQNSIQTRREKEIGKCVNAKNCHHNAEIPHKLSSRSSYRLPRTNLRLCPIASVSINLSWA